mmetsp:Transcript_150273/g.482898  ORF Transcript_150273/g.482898 Transcript_150273/m.482898 type:complete len:321 (-) Transcript_150273:2372-3334(-)
MPSFSFAMSSMNQYSANNRDSDAEGAEGAEGKGREAGAEGSTDGSSGPESAVEGSNTASAASMPRPSSGTDGDRGDGADARNGERGVYGVAGAAEAGSVGVVKPSPARSGKVGTTNGVFETCLYENAADGDFGVVIGSVGGGNSDGVWGAGPPQTGATSPLASGGVMPRMLPASTGTRKASTLCAWSPSCTGLGSRHSRHTANELSLLKWHPGQSHLFLQRPSRGVNTGAPTGTGATIDICGTKSPRSAAAMLSSIAASEQAAPSTNALPAPLAIASSCVAPAVYSAAEAGASWHRRSSNDTIRNSCRARRCCPLQQADW